MKTKWIEKEFKYDGTQLHSLFAYLEHGAVGDSVVAWQGECNISFEHMVDGEDFLERSEIRSEKMLHFIIERFDTPLFSAVLIQRMFAALCLEELRSRLPTLAHDLRRDGDDIFWNDRKLSISIATVSPVSALIHFAVNITNAGTPVKTCALDDFRILPRDFAESLMKRLGSEIDTILFATQKVHWVK